ncbi:T-cell receptor gamma alternate reading frame protein isoform X4 [Saccopteryx bilineata]|uniref:T-cell receptor gamma alternate reading frame protein isoform X4 n=1 Tax=Saccopteryx bilineata TaxID=59482 RepID=UPI00338E1D26
MPQLEAVLFFSLWAFGFGQLKLEQPEISVSGEKYMSARISCKVSSDSFSKEYIHWYQQKPNQGIEHLIYVVSTTPAREKNNKYEASKNVKYSTSTLRINFLEKEDEAVYFCACWYVITQRWRKIFAEGTKLIVIPPDRSLGSDISPKATTFLPSVAEINLHKAGTYLCLLEKFFPDVIKVDWKEKNSNTILGSQQGNAMKTNDTYMKFSWLTVNAKSMEKEHKCIIRHENNKRGVDQEILFPSIQKGIVSEAERFEDATLPATRMEDHEPKNAKNKALDMEADTVQLQLTNTSAYYTYLLLLLKSLVYLAIISFCLFRRTAVCSPGKSS